MDDNGILRLNLSMSPRAIDELKDFSSVKGVSKYELPLIMFPEEKAFEIFAAVSDSQIVMLGFDINGKNVTLCGKLEHNNFFCTSVSGKKIDGKGFTLYFSQEKNEDFTYINEQVKARFSMWYDYIESVMKKAETSSRIFFCKGASVKNGKIEIVTYDLKPGTIVRDLTIGFLDDQNRPAWGFGVGERLENDILTVRLFGNDTIGIMKELSSGIRLIAYDGASDITCKRMKSGLDKLCSGGAVNKRLPEFIFDPSKSNRTVGENITLNNYELLAKNMNPEQIRAVEGVLNAEDLYLIQGPPGTGKTTVIAEICYQNAIRGLKTLIVSQSNLAVDNAISRVMNHADLRVLRKGDSSRVEEEGLPFVEDNVVGTWISQIAEATKNMDDNISAKINNLKKKKQKFPDILSAAENVNELKREKNAQQSQLYFYKNVIDEAKKLKTDFFELIARAYETDNIEYAENARSCYPPDFKIPNGIYNDLESRYLDIKADVEIYREYTDELDFLNYFTEKFSAQFEYIRSKVSRKMMENTAYEGIFYYADRKMVSSLFDEGEKIIDSEPLGIKKIIFGHKWRQVAAIYYRRAENLIISIQQKTIRLCERIYKIENDSIFIDNVKSFHLCLDALGEDYDNQYYGFKAKYEKSYNDSADADREYNYVVELFKEKIQDEFFSKALNNIDPRDISIQQVEYNINRYFQLKYTRYDKWKKLLDEWRRKISCSNARNYGALKKLYIENANVIGITCIQSGTKDFSDNYPSFDTVIIDEASKSTPPDIILPMLKAKKIVLVGDHKQLPPFIDSDAYDELGSEDPQLKQLIKTSLFEELYEKADGSMKTMLFRQYRMHRDIAALINQFYIDTDAGRLESPASEFKKHCCQGMEISEDNHVMWYDTPCGEGYYEKQKNKSFYNVYETECVKKILCILEKNLTENNCKKSIGIITFYDAQVKLFEEQIVNSGFYKRFGHISIRIGSVDKFQGMEEDIIILSFVRNNSGHMIGFAKDSRRINVAMSRARELLIIVGCYENFAYSADNQASEMFRNAYNIISRLDGIRKADKIPDVKLPEGSYNNMEKYAVNANIDTIQQSDEDEEVVNILDYFILKAAYEFAGQPLYVKNISNVLGIAPVFVESRAECLKKQNYIEYKNKTIKLCGDCEKTVGVLLNDYNM